MAGFHWRNASLCLFRRADLSMLPMEGTQPPKQMKEFINQQHELWGEKRARNTADYQGHVVTESGLQGVGCRW